MSDIARAIFSFGLALFGLFSIVASLPRRSQRTAALWKLPLMMLGTAILLGLIGAAVGAWLRPQGGLPAGAVAFALVGLFSGMVWWIRSIATGPNAKAGREKAAPLPVVIGIPLVGIIGAVTGLLLQFSKSSEAAFMPTLLALIGILAGGILGSAKITKSGSFRLVEPGQDDPPAAKDAQDK